MLTMPFTVAVFMVRAFEGGEGDEAQIGRMTGLLAAVYSFAQFTTSYAWGVFSSKFGRKVRTGWCSVVPAAGLKVPGADWRCCLGNSRQLAAWVTTPSCVLLPPVSPTARSR